MFNDTSTPKDISYWGVRQMIFTYVKKQICRYIKIQINNYY